MLTEIKINNIRSLNFEDYIKISPLTILLGKNSSGKSTFLRTFPLIKQSIETRRSAPLLWYGRLVDFGSFDETKNKYSSENKIQISFKLNGGNIEKIIEIDLTKENEIEYIEKVVIKYKNNEIIMDFNAKKEIKNIIINGKEKEEKKWICINFKDMIPSGITEKEENSEEKNLFIKRELTNPKPILKKIAAIFGIKNQKNKECDEKEFEYYLDSISRRLYFDSDELYHEKELFELILKYLKQDFDNSKDTNTKEENSNFRFVAGRNLKTKAIIENLEYDFEVKFEKVIDKMLILKEMLIFHNLNDILDLINNEIEDFFDSVFYVAPLRATAERYYRIQGINTDDINPDGNNLPMYLKSLSFTELQNFSNWTNENFGFKPDLTNKGGHISLEISQDGNKINLTDTGFGFSQILPIVVQIWRKINRNYFKDKSTQLFLIEQPELHLHPGMQAMLIDVIIKSIKIAKDRDIDARFILETHSETIVNRIGIHIMEELFEEKNVNLVIFNKKDKKLEIKETGYASDGAIREWPFGFFKPEVIIK